MTDIKIPKKPRSTHLTKAIEATNDKELAMLHVYVPVEDIAALRLYALNQRSNASVVMRMVLRDFLDTVQA